MKIINKKIKLSVHSATFMVFVFFATFAMSAQTKPSAPQVKEGKKLYKRHCIACHRLHKKSIGPALYKVAERRDEKWLKAWIKNNKKLRSLGDKDAIAVFKKYRKIAMPAFKFLTDKQIKNIIAYTSVGDKK